VNSVFTVVITEQLHLDGIAEYKTFLEPFLNAPGVAYCAWHPEGRTLEEAVPDLAATVSRHEHWRLVAVCPDDRIDRKNPFDLVSWTAPTASRDWELPEYLAQLRQAKSNAYTQAIRQPLTKLMTWLCESPMVTDGMNNAQEDPEFAAYMADVAEKSRLRRELIGDFVPDFTLPDEILCLSMRCCPDATYDIRTSWTRQQDSQYSRFYDRNLYFDKMRYLVFDILPKNHRNYTFDYIRFLYTLTLLARHETPQSSLSPNRVYTLFCDTDEAALRELLGRYDSKLASSEAFIRHQYKELEQTVRPQLSDRDAKMLFCSNMAVPVANSVEFERETLYAPARGIGLAGDCPRDEEGVWGSRYRASRRALTKFLKTPGRSLRKATTQLRHMTVADLDHAGQLNEYQLEDVADFVRDQEMQMIATPTSNFSDTAGFTQRLEEKNQALVDVMERRMTKNWTIVLGIAALVCYIVGFLPMFFGNHAAEQQTELVWRFFGIGFGSLLLIAFITLFFLRRPVKTGYSNYNGAMRSIENEVDSSLRQFSVYLGHTCNMMRGYSVLNYCGENEHPDETRMRIYRKHLADIEKHRMELEDIFGSFLPQQGEEIDLSQGYDYDFTRPVDFVYPMPYSSGQNTTVDFLQKGNPVEVPVNFIRSMHLRREELYE
jgi:hypothetical protein